ncbi:MAG TPA: tetratricopeptide repeat protein [Chthoniobacterales bacterium]|nr:tetratricopeptide repeat protein [Chthoniobacterales bacterium]
MKFEIGHVLFIDIVGYSKLLINEQSDQIQKLKEVVRGTDQVRLAEAEGKLLRLPTGDGGALVFQNSPEAPVLCAMEIAKGLKNHPELRVRMGIHSGPVNAVTDLNEQANVAGAGINIAQRVMDCGDAGHILLSRHVAEDLEHYPRWQAQLHDLGECEVKHGVRTSVVNLYNNEVGNPAVPERFRKASAVALPTQRPVPKSTKPYLALGIVSLAALAIFAVVFGPRFVRSRDQSAPPNTARPNDRSTTPASAKSIAVLPFDNLSNEKENAYFAEGIQDEILTRLAKIADLKVISRTSTQKYKSAPDNLREIGRQLGVANLLEGSVQKIANAVHVNVQLIRASNDEHIWAESYNRKLDDVFGVEGEVAGAIAEQLNAKLSGAEKHEVADRPTSNLEAYDAYLHGLAFFDRPDLLGADLLSAVESFEKAVRLDPNFALVWAKLSTVHSSLFFDGDDTSSERSAAAHEALQKALQLQPDLLETQLAEAYYHYFVERDYDRARQIFGLIHQQSPNNSEAPLALALIGRRRGRWEESLAHFHEAIELDPRNLRTLMWTSDTYRSMRQFPTALKFIDRALDIAPGDNGALVRKVDAYQALGQLDQAETVVAQMHADSRDTTMVQAMARQLLLRNNYPAGVALMQSSLPKLDPSQHFDRCVFLLFLAQFQQLIGDAVGSKANYTQSREETEALLRQQPDNADLISALAMVDAGLGDKETALQEAELAMAKLPASRDALIGPLYEEVRARVLARFGDKDRSITILQHLLAIPYAGSFGAPVTTAYLRLDPDWDHLRGDPRFQKLCQDTSK